MEDGSDAELIAASVAAPARFGPIFDRHATALHRYLVRRLGPGDAESMVGDVFRIAFERRATYDLGRPDARPWLYGIATNLVARHRRAEGRRVRAIARLAAERVESADPSDEATTRLDGADRFGRVAEALAALPQRELDALLLHAWESLPYAQIAEALDVPVGTVRSRINRARRRLRELTAASGEQRDEHDEHDEHDERTDVPRAGRI